MATRWRDKDPQSLPETQATEKHVVHVVHVQEWGSVWGGGELTVHELGAYRDSVLHKKGTEERDDVRRVALQWRREAA